MWHYSAGTSSHGDLYFKDLVFPLEEVCVCVCFPTPLAYSCICPLGGSEFCSLSTHCRKGEYFSLFG